MALKWFPYVFNINSLPTHREAILDPFLNVLKINIEKIVNAPLIYIILSIFPLYAPFLWRGREKEKSLMKAQQEKQNQGIKDIAKQLTVRSTNL